MSLPPLPIPERGEVYRLYVRLYAMTGAWAERFEKLYLRGVYRVPPRMLEDAKAARERWLRGERPEGWGDDGWRPDE